MGASTEIGGGILLAVAAQPIHEGGHALATWIVTGLWPRIGFWAVYPAGDFHSKFAALVVLAAGDIAVLVWWTFLFLLVRRQPHRNWVLVGPMANWERPTPPGSSRFQVSGRGTSQWF